MEIIRGTTPTFVYTFSDIDVGSIVDAYLVIKQFGKTKIEKGIASAVIEEGKLAFSLTQADTLSLSRGSIATVYCDWKLNSGVRGRCNVVDATVTDSGKDAVI